MIARARLVSVATLSLGVLLVASLNSCSARPQNNATETKVAGKGPDQATKTEPGKTNEVAGGVSKKDFELSVLTSSGPKVGTPITATITLIPAAGLHVNQEFPHKVTLSALPAGVECPKTELKKEDAKIFNETRAEFEVSCTAKDGGPKEFQGEYKFSVCTDSYCATPKEKLAWKFDVQQ